MKLKKKLIYSSITAAAVLVTSILIPITPCRKFPNIPNPIHKWTLCTLNPDKIQSLNSVTEYLGYTTSIRDTYFLIIIIAFIAAMMFFHYISRKKSKRK